MSAKVRFTAEEQKAKKRAYAKRSLERRKANGLCRVCDRPRWLDYVYCEKHHMKSLEYARRRDGTKPWNPDKKGNKGLCPRYLRSNYPPKPKREPKAKAKKPATVDLASKFGPDIALAAAALKQMQEA